MMTRQTVLQRIAIDLKKHLLELESHASLLKKQIFDLEKQFDDLNTDLPVEIDRAIAGGNAKPCCADC